MKIIYNVQANQPRNVQVVDIGVTKTKNDDQFGT